MMCAQSGYNQAVIFLESYTKPWGEHYIYDYDQRAKLENKLSSILYRWHLEVGSPLGVIGWYISRDENDNPKVSIELRNLSDKTIVAFEAEWTCYITDEETAKRTEIIKEQNKAYIEGFVYALSAKTKTIIVDSDGDINKMVGSME